MNSRYEKRRRSGPLSPYERSRPPASPAHMEKMGWKNILSKKRKKWRPFYSLACIRRNPRVPMHWWLVVRERTWRRPGKFIEWVGSYTETPDPRGYRQIRVKNERIKYWLGNQVGLTSKSHHILQMAGLVPRLP